MKGMHHLTVILACMCLAACASNTHRRPQAGETFVTGITSDNVKRFSYTAEFTVSGNHGGRHRRGSTGGYGGMAGAGMGGGTGGYGGMGGGRGHQAETQERMSARFEPMLKEKLEKIGYCRDGYEITDRNIGRGVVQILGQCRELANAADIKKFKDQKINEGRGVRGE